MKSFKQFLSEEEMTPSIGRIDTRQDRTSINPQEEGLRRLNVERGMMGLPPLTMKDISRGGYSALLDGPVVRGVDKKNLGRQIENVTKENERAFPEDAERKQSIDNTHVRTYNVLVDINDSLSKLPPNPLDTISKIFITPAVNSLGDTIHKDNLSNPTSKFYDPNEAIRNPNMTSDEVRKLVSDDRKAKEIGLIGTTNQFGNPTAKPYTVPKEQ